MTETQLQRMAQAAAVIRLVVGSDFRCCVPDAWDPWPATAIHQQMQASARKRALLILQHDRGEPLAPYVNYDCCEYDKIEQLSSALGEIGLMVEDKTGWWSGVYEEVQ
jgi:hypothetical protein